MRYLVAVQSTREADMLFASDVTGREGRLI